MLNLNSPRLIITPSSLDHASLDQDTLISLLQQDKFLGSSLSANQSDRTNTPCFDIGDDFLHQVTFLGCSPTLSGDNHVFVSIVQSDSVVFYHSSEVPPPRCPLCNKTDKNWRNHWQQWNQDQAALSQCPHCEKSFSFSEMKWKKNGGYGKLLIQVHGVQEQLAVPNEQFLEALQQQTNMEWCYFFADTDSPV